MNPSPLIPTPDAIPVPWGWFYILLMLTFLLHILVMNVMLGGGIIAVISMLNNNKNTNLIAKEFSYKWPYTIAFAVNMGVAPLLFVQVLYGHFIYSSSVLMAAWWLSIVGLLILAYYSAYIFDFKYDQLGGLKIIAASFSVIIMLFIAFLFSNNMTLMLQPEKWTAYMDNRNGTILNLSDPSLWPRYLHFVLGAIGVAGLFLALVGRLGFCKSKVDPELLVNKGMTYFTHTTIFQIIIGFWFLIALPQPVMKLFMGGSILATVLLVLGIALALVALLFGFKKDVLKTTIATLLLLITMIFMRDVVRAGYLSQHFSLDELVVQPEYSSMIFFLIVFVAGLAMIGYMLKLVFSMPDRETKDPLAEEGA